VQSSSAEQVASVKDGVTTEDAPTPLRQMPKELPKLLIPTDLGRTPSASLELPAGRQDSLDMNAGPPGTPTAGTGADAMPAVLERAGWTQQRSRTTGKTYYFNNDLQISTYHFPLPPGWTRHISRTNGKPYYFHSKLRVSQYEYPAGDDFEAAIMLPLKTSSTELGVASTAIASTGIASSELGQDSEYDIARSADLDVFMGAEDSAKKTISVVSGSDIEVVRSSEEDSTQEAALKVLMEIHKEHGSDFAALAEKTACSETELRANPPTGARDFAQKILQGAYQG